MDPLRLAVKAMRTEVFQQTPQWTLGQLIDALRNVDASDDCDVSFAFGYFVPTTCASWRGSYDEIAIGYALNDSGGRPTLKDFLSHLRSCVGKEFTGWKGGTFTMDVDTPVWVAEPGDSGNTGVIGIRREVGANGKAYRVHIRTDYCEF